MKELIVMSGSGLKPGGQRIQAQERILVDEICLDVIVVNFSSDDRVEEGSLSSCKLSSDDGLSSSSKLFMRLFICLRNSSTGSPSTGTGRVGLDLGYQFILCDTINLSFTYLRCVYIERYLGCSGGPEGRFISKTSTMSSSGALKKEIFRIAMFDKRTM